MNGTKKKRGPYASRPDKPTREPMPIKPVITGPDGEDIVVEPKIVTPRRDVTKTLGANENTRKLLKKMGYTE